MGNTSLRTVQIGRETTWGTSVAATAILSGVLDASVTPRVVTSTLRTLTGSFAPATEAIILYKQGQASISGYLTPEDFIYVADSAIKGAVSPSGSGPYVYTFPAPLTAVPGTRSRTLEFYDGSQEYEMDGSLVESFTLSGETGDAEDGYVKFESSWVGQEVTASTLTGSLTGRTYNVIPCNTCRLYVDSFGGTVGTTELTATLISWNLEYNTGIHLKKFGSANLTPDSYGYNVPEITLQLTLEANASGVAEVTALLAGTKRLIQIRGVGASSTQMDVQMAGVATEPPELWGDRDGNTTITVSYKAVYDPGSFANYFKLILTNNVSAFVTGA